MTMFYCVVSLVKYILGLWIAYKLYPEKRFRSRILQGIFVVLLIGEGILDIQNNYNCFLSNSLVLFESILITVFTYGLLKAKFYELFAWHFFYFSTWSLLNMPTLILTGIQAGKNMYEVNYGERTFFQVGYSFIILFGVALFGLIQREKVYDLLKKLVFHYSKIMVIISVMEWCMLTYCMHLGQRGFKPEVLIINLAFIICTVLLFLYILINNLYQDKKNENARMDMIQRLLKEQNLLLRDFYNQHQQERHDMKHKALCLMKCLEEDGAEAATECLSTWMETLQIKEQKVWTGFSFLDFFINYKKTTMDQKAIALELEIDVCKIPMKDEDLGVVLGNLFDNALEAAEQCQAGKRWISLKIKNWNSMFLLSLSNSSIRLPKMQGECFVTTKSDQNVHGLGVESVKRVIEKYDGHIIFHYDQEHFEVQILLEEESRNEGT